MWIYEHVDGVVRDFFPGVVEAVGTLLERGPHARSLEQSFERLQQAVAALPAELVPFADATDDDRASVRAGYVATLELAQLLDRMCEDSPTEDRRLITATYEVLDFLEEWRPYISTEDAALHLVMLDGVELAEAVEIVTRTPGTDDDCPICAAMRSGT